MLSFSLYDYGMSAQLKIVIDRFCVYDSGITGKYMKSIKLWSGTLYFENAVL